jgi:flagellar basal-body rod modification protein FlgD
LAQINTVNGIEKLNTTLSQLLSAYDDSKSMQAANMIGKNVLVPGSNMVSAANGTMAGGALLASDADKVTVSILDSTGKVVQTEDLGAKKAGSFAFVWDGKDSSGNAAPAGSYTFKVDATSGGDTVKATALQFGTVSALVRGTNGFQLDLGDAGTVNLDDVQQIF